MTRLAGLIANYNQPYMLRKYLGHGAYESVFPFWGSAVVSIFQAWVIA